MLLPLIRYGDDRARGFEAAFGAEQVMSAIDEGYK